MGSELILVFFAFGFAAWLISTLIKACMQPVQNREQVYFESPIKEVGIDYKKLRYR